MSRPVKELLRNELSKRLEGVTSMAMVGFAGVDAVAANELRRRLMKKNIRMRVVKNSVARQAFRSVGLEKAADLLEGPCAVAWGADSVVTVVRELLEAGKDTPNLTVKAAYMEGEVFGAEAIKRLSKYPTRDEAIGRIVAAAMCPGRKLAGCLAGPGASLASILKTIEEKQAPGDGATEQAAA
jgi:large subunit ribosomal protein L10